MIKKKYKKRRMDNELKELLAEALGIELKCVGCGSYENIHLAHKIPLCRGGKNIIANIEFKCKKCHRARRRKEEDRKYYREYMRNYWRTHLEQYEKHKQRAKQWERKHRSKSL